MPLRTVATQLGLSLGADARRKPHYLESRRMRHGANDRADGTLPTTNVSAYGRGATGRATTPTTARPNLDVKRLGAGVARAALLGGEAYARRNGRLKGTLPTANAPYGRGATESDSQRRCDPTLDVECLGAGATRVAARWRRSVCAAAQRPRGGLTSDRERVRASSRRARQSDEPTTARPNLGGRLGAGVA
jgi:hypothetical protein